ncbi:zinc-binding alcohol dehydrogenase family protein [Rugamonas sp. CCM 8940]|uniref:zinc-binding alcohol dehydrogenase family protein n=1 Tax=Rugamonas sp. CCM 8940 TaxID=2765359 RepID=UPI0018F66471|nr:zinc-binding alcohol dehydrogenase family protein [Rugamonas sp. CCM 8940]MBJ7309839.1 zinc-binding alcohol dehydrogenase family protein [Rugamonas sp. CCM 8940]
MKAIALTQHLPISHAESLKDVELARPVALGRDLLVKIEAISVNPVDTKVRGAAGPDEAAPRVLGWDAAGTVVAVGPDASLFQVGDPVYYAGSITRPGANSEFHLVDERIAGRKPASLDFADAAALPLTSITAWEALFERLAIRRDGADAGKSILMIGGAGGVGSIAIQLAKQLAGLRVIASASRAESAQWCRSLGADDIVDHNGDMPAQLLALGLANVDYVLCLSDTDPHFDAIAQVIAPQGSVCSIVSNTAPLAMEKIFAKSVKFVWEMMFTRSMFGTPDMIEQHHLLQQIGGLIDGGRLRTTVGENFGKINAANLRRAHQALEARRTIGKIVLSGF